MEQEKKAAEVDLCSRVRKGNWHGSQTAHMYLRLILMVKDHRTNFEVAQVDKVMDGDLDGFIDAYLKWRSGSESATRQSLNRDVVENTIFGTTEP